MNQCRRSLETVQVVANKNDLTKTVPHRQSEQPVKSSPAEQQTTTLAETHGLTEERVRAPKAGVRQRSGEASRLNTAAGETGIASFFYSESNRDELTAAYSNVPVGTRVRVTNVTNGRTVVVRVTNRGPTVNRARLINVSYRAAAELGFARAGTARVSVVPE